MQCVNYWLCHCTMVPAHPSSMCKKKNDQGQRYKLMIRWLRSQTMFRSGEWGGFKGWKTIMVIKTPWTHSWSSKYLNMIIHNNISLSLVSYKPHNKHLQNVRVHHRRTTNKVQLPLLFSIWVHQYYM